MVEIALRTLREVDVILFLVDAVAGPGGGDEYVLEKLKNVNTPVILVINKIDCSGMDRAQELVNHYLELYAFQVAVAISALEGRGTEELLQLILKHLPEGPMYYPEDMVTDQPERFIIAELIREKLLQLTWEEVPHAIAVEIVSHRKRPGRELVDIEANIYVERESQKGIVIGKGGRMLKEAGRLARLDIEALLGVPVNLKLWVKVKPDWRNKAGSWHSLGLDLE